MKRLTKEQLGCFEVDRDLQVISCRSCGARAGLPCGREAHTWPEDGEGAPLVRVDDDGDEVIIGPDWLQAQWDFMEAHHACALRWAP